ncbi:MULTISPECIES: calcium/sodium antiporter [Thioclava]|uniref:Calcium/sodium antiporter n=1 Tax=Thioclava litoralis TaxID=3076557 RepID=A0ABZ1E1L7_9RHOB|nr:calcium/sodium antiporter [Thioclava sp. FTW29]
MLIDIAMVVAGLVLLVVAGDWLVKGAVNLSLRLGIPALVVSLTVVAFGTSAPELLVSVTAVLDHSPAIALGNVIGSNTANILLVLGLPALISVIRTNTHDTRESYLMMLAGTVLFIVLALSGPITWAKAIVLLLAMAAILTRQIRQALQHRHARHDSHDSREDVEGAEDGLHARAIALYLLLGLVGLPVGANLLVTGASDIASAIGISDAVIGLTLVAVGTSLPELATSVSAALRGRADVALGNVIGSNIFNLLFILGIAGLFGQMPVPPEMLRIDLWVMLAAALVLGPFILLRQPMGRVTGLAFTLAYIAYIWAIVAA